MKKVPIAFDAINLNECFIQFSMILSEPVLENLALLSNLGYAARVATAKPQVVFLLSTLAHVQSLKLHLGTTAVCLSEFIPLTAVNPCDSADGLRPVGV